MEILPSSVFILLVQYESLNLRCFMLGIREFLIIAINNVMRKMLASQYLKVLQQIYSFRTEDWKLLFLAVNSGQG